MEVKCLMNIENKTRILNSLAVILIKEDIEGSW